MNRQAEAIQLFDRVVGELLSPNHDLKLVLRTCSHACTLLSWAEQLRWFQHELQGYAAGEELPWYRRNVAGLLEWKSDNLEAAVSSVAGGRTFPSSTLMTTDVSGGVPWIQSLAVSGYSDRTGNTDTYTAVDRRQYQIHELRVFPATSYTTVLTRIDEATFQFASSAYATLQYGNALSDVWQSYRQIVDAKLTDMGLQQHFVTIEKGLVSGNPQDWRALLYTCRDVLHDVAAYLWQDPRPSYTPLEGSSKSGKLPVTESDYLNRLGAYLHQKEVAGTTGQYLRSEIERLYECLQRLNSLASTAHGGATLGDARTVALGTYFLLGELIQRTDMVPVTQYSDQPSEQ